MTPQVLWGDGAHDDTAALNAWFRGGRVVWGQTDGPVGSLIVGHVFRLKGAVLIPSGTGRSIERFELYWPERRERVSGGSIRAGSDPDKPPIATGIVKVGAGPDEGVAYPAPDLPPGRCPCRHRLPRFLRSLPRRPRMAPTASPAGAIRRRAMAARPRRARRGPSAAATSGPPIRGTGP